MTKPTQRPSRRKFDSPESGGSKSLARVLDSEHDYIENRRGAVFGAASIATGREPGDSSREPPKQLVGLAFSGGGIRSATFNLGVLQALEKHGVFKFVDYLSTVSGGGFLGCALSTLLSQRAIERPGQEASKATAEKSSPEAGEVSEETWEERSEFPLRFNETEEEMPAVSYLRNNSNYLAPRGLLDYLRIFAVLVRGIILNFLVLLPFLLMSSMVVTWYYGQGLLERLQRDDNLAEVTDLLERNWIGMEAEQPVEELLDALVQRGMLDVQRGMTRGFVVEWLKGDEKRGGLRGEALPALIKGQSEDDEGGNRRVAFRDGVTVRNIVERLWESGTLRNLDALREIDAVEQAVRASRTWESSAQRGGQKLSLENLYSTLREEGAIDATAALSSRQRMREILLRETGQLVACQASVESVEAEAPLGVDPLSGCRATGAKPNLRRILQELYARGFYDPAWLSQNRNRSPTGRVTPALAYWQAYELAKLEDALSETLDGDPAGIERAAGSDPSVPRGEVKDLAPVEGAPGEEGGDGDPAQAAEARLDLAGVTNFLTRSGLLRELAPEEDEQIRGLLVSHRTAWDGEASDGQRIANARHELARALWDRSLLDPQALERLLGEAEAGGHVLAYTGDPSTEAGTANARAERPFRGTLVLLVTGLVWVLLYPLLLLLVAVGAVQRLAARKGARWWRDLYERSFALLLVLVAVVAFIEIQPYLIYQYHQLYGGNIWWPLGIGAASLTMSMIAGPAIAYLQGIGKSVVLVLVAMMGPVLPLLVYMHLVLWAIYQQPFWNGYYLLNRPLLAVSFVAAAIVVHFVNLPIDVNSTSLHGFYRDRLSAAYLMRRNPGRRRKDGSAADDRVEPAEDLRLDQLCNADSGAPYHLINATLNLQGAKDPSLRRRRGDFFLFSKEFVGSKQTGYCSTRELLKVFPHLHVSSAMAVSAAAASPNMGTFTSGPIVVLMALLNIRLGFWLPNPRRIRNLDPASGLLGRLRRFASLLAGSFQARPGAYQLVREMLSDLRADVRLINLSDGGHMENTGAYGLLRRRCQFIIVSDAEADPQMRFGGLAALMRYARIDLGIEIDIHVDDLRLDEQDESRQHCALGVIHYPATEELPADVGYLLYIKASITGDESEVVFEHHLKSPDFPHESTADQSFEEGQFEAYRDLGFHICDGLFDSFHRRRVDTFEECSEWFEMLSIALSPGLSGKVSFTDIQSALGDIRRMLREQRYRGYFYEIYPEWKPAGHTSEADSAADDESFRNVFHLVAIQLQLMESLFVASELSQRANRRHPANRGWMNLFRRWATAPSFRRAYVASVTTFSAPFQQFCDSALGLKLLLDWEEHTLERYRELVGDDRLFRLEVPETAAGIESIPLLLTARLEGTERILIAELVVQVEGREARVHELRLRAGYQGAGMRARSMLALKAWAQDPNRDLVLGFSEAASVAARNEEFDFE